MYQQVFPREQVAACYDSIGGGHFFFVQRNTAALNQFAGLAFRREDRSLLGAEVDKADTFGECRCGNFELGNALENLEESLLVDLAQSVGGRVSKEDARCFDGLVVLLLGVNHAGNLFGEPLLQFAQVRRFAVCGDQRVDRLFVEHCEDFDVALGVFVADIEPELVEFVGRRIARIEPDVARFGFTEFGAVGFFDQRAGKAERFAAGLAADQLRTGGDVAPLV